MNLEQYVEQYFIENNIPLINSISKKSTVKLAVLGRIKVNWSGGAQVNFIKQYFPDKPKFIQLKTYIPSLNNDKYCSDCEQVLPLDLFTQDKSSIHGKTHICKNCDSNRYKDYYLNNKEYKNRKSAEHYRNNKKMYRAKDAKYRASKLNRTPPWADIEKIKEFYLNCPKGYEVDHIIPLQGKLISGLHVLENLQYLTVTENRQKSNKWLNETK